MATSIINSDDGLVSGTSGLKTTGGNDGNLEIQANGSTIIALTPTSVAVSGTLSSSGNFSTSGNATVAKAARGTITTDNDGSFDMNVASNFKCTPTGNFTLTFTNITSGQVGNIILVNSGGYTISAAATTKVSTTALATISAAGTYWLSYISDGTSVFVSNTGALA